MLACGRDLGCGLRRLAKQFPYSIPFHNSRGSVFRCMLRPLLHLSQSNAVLDRSPINGDRELGRRAGNRLDRSGGAKFGDRMSDSLIQRVRVNLNGMEDSILIGE